MQTIEGRTKQQYSIYGSVKNRHWEPTY